MIRIEHAVQRGDLVTATITASPLWLADLSIAFPETFCLSNCQYFDNDLRTYTIESSYNSLEQIIKLASAHNDVDLSADTKQFIEWSKQMIGGHNEKNKLIFNIGIDCKTVDQKNKLLEYFKSQDIHGTSYSDTIIFNTGLSISDIEQLVNLGLINRGIQCVLTCVGEEK